MLEIVPVYLKSNVYLLKKIIRPSALHPFNLFLTNSLSDKRPDWGLTEEAGLPPLSELSIRNVYIVYSNINVRIHWKLKTVSKKLKRITTKKLKVLSELSVESWLQYSVGTGGGQSQNPSTSPLSSVHCTALHYCTALHCTAALCMCTWLVSAKWYVWDCRGDCWYRLMENSL